MMYRNWGYRRNHIKETESKIIFLGKWSRGMLTLTRTQVWSRKFLANLNMHRLCNYLRKPLVDFFLILTLTPVQCTSSFPVYLSWTLTYFVYYVQMIRKTAFPSLGKFCNTVCSLLSMFWVKMSSCFPFSSAVFILITSFTLTKWLDSMSKKQ